MSLAYPRSDADRTPGVGIGRVPARETHRGTVDVVTAVPEVYQLRRTRPWRFENTLARPARILPAGFNPVELYVRDGVPA